MYNTKDFSEKLGVTTCRIQQLARVGKFGEKIGRDWIFTESDLRTARNLLDKMRKARPRISSVA